MRRAIPGAPEAQQVARVARQCHPRYVEILRCRTYATLEDLARACRCIEKCILTERSYVVPPSPTHPGTLEPLRTWPNSPMRASPVGGPATMDDSPCTSTPSAYVQRWFTKPIEPLRGEANREPRETSMGYCTVISLFFYGVWKRYTARLNG